MWNMSSLDTAVSILNCFSPESPELAVSDAVKRLGLPKSTVSRLMKAMADCGLVEQHHETRRYRIGLLPFRLGQLYQVHAKVLELAEAALDRLVQETGFTGYIGVLNGTDIVILRSRHGRYPVRVVLEPGYRVPAFATAFGKALLARLPDDELRALLPDTLRYELTGLRWPRAKFLAELGTVRRRLWADAREETFPGVGAIGVAIGSNDRQQPIGVSLSFPTSAVSSREQAEMVKRLVGFGREIATRTDDPMWVGHGNGAASMVGLARSSRPSSARRRPRPGRTASA
jgi:DNA-binding IclR family transcriptional regulator